MTTAQKIIKYFGIGLAFSIIIGIFSCLMYGLSMISSFFSDKSNYIIEKLEDVNINSDSVSILSIDINYANLIIKEGDSLKVETNNRYITSSNRKNKLIIKEKKHGVFKRSENRDLIIYFPKDFVFDGIFIDAGAGKIEIDSLKTEVLEFDLGAGKTNINNLTVFGSSEVEGGAGEINITNSSINNLDLDTGVGKCILKSELLGKNEINIGVGKLYITLLGSEEEYRIVAEKGIGVIKLSNEDIKSNQVYGNGVNSIEISGGIGNINIDFEKQVKLQNL